MIKVSLKNTIALFLIFIFYIILASCDKKNEFSPGCKNIQDSSFSIKEAIGLDGNLRYFETDTIVASRNKTYFVANDSLADEYIWRFGFGSQVLTGKSVGIVFNQAVGDVQITLSVKRNPTNPCFRPLTAQSEYSKKVTVVEPSASPLIGSYYGYNSSNKSTYFVIQVLSNGIKNFPFKTTGDYYFRNEIIYGSSAFYIAGAGTYDPDFGAYATEGFGYLFNHGKNIEIDYKYKKPFGSSDYLNVEDTFYGIKQ